MGDATKRPLNIPPWQIPYLEKHRIFELFHELARELVVQQPDDHVLFLKQILYNAAKSRDSARVIILSSPKINCSEIANGITAITNQKIITEHTLLTLDKKEMSPERKAQCIAYLVHRENVYKLGWILIDCIRDERDAKALLRLGILPTHVIHLIPPFHPPMNELIYCRIPPDWPDFRRKVAAIRHVFKHTLREVFLHQRAVEDIVAECVEILNTKPAKHPIKPRVLILGPRGSGRKTQARLLADNLGVINVDFERLICQAWMSEAEMGKKLRCCKSDVCFHSELLAEVIHKRVLEKDCMEHGWVLTGFPYSKRDFEYLDCIHTPPNRVIFLECDLSICRDRLCRKVNVRTGSLTNLKQHPEAEIIKELKIHPKDNADFIDAELSYFCENYGEMKRYCGSTAVCINAAQSERWIYETIISIITRAPTTSSPRTPLQNSSSGLLSADICCCSPIPSQVFDCYSTKL